MAGAYRKHYSCMVLFCGYTDCMAKKESAGYNPGEMHTNCRRFLHILHADIFLLGVNTHLTGKNIGAGQAHKR